MTDSLIPPYVWERFCRGASPGRQWNAEAIEAAHAEVERYATELVANLGLPDVTHPRKARRRISVEDVRAAVDNAKDAYTLQLEQKIELHAQRCEAFRAELAKRRGAQ